MKFLHALGRFISCCLLVIPGAGVGAAVFYTFVMVCTFTVGGPAGLSLDTAVTILFALVLAGAALGATAGFVVWCRLTPEEGRPCDPALPEVGPRWADRPGARPPDSIRPDQAGVSEHPGPGAERERSP
jgi:hypothetical protein